MAEKPIIMSAPMVRALLDGRKTQTRRIVKLPHNNSLGTWEPMTIGGPGCTDGRGMPAEEKLSGIWHTRTGDAIAASYQSGDHLWVRETCRAEELGDDWTTYPKHIIDEYVDESNHAAGLDGVRYLADDYFRPIENSIAASEEWMVLNCYRGKRGATVPPIHMPRWASRITLEVSSVRVERLQDISHDDAKAEGITFIGIDDFNHVMAFRKLWDSINAKRAPWDSNPWIWVITFRHDDGR